MIEIRSFSSYGPVNTKINYYAPRKELIDFAIMELSGKKFELEIFKTEKNVENILKYIEKQIARELNKKSTDAADTSEKFQELFSKIDVLSYSY